MRKPVNINNILIYPFGSQTEILDYLTRVTSTTLIAVNAEKILHITEPIRAFINQNTGYADGIGAVWAMKRKGHTDAIKIPGCELWLGIIRHFSQSKSFYFVGAKEEIIKQTIEKLKTDFPGINIIGFRNGYIKTESEQKQLIKAIATMKPDIVFVAMGSPKQELLMQEMQQHHPAIYQGLGGSFDVYVGNVERAPSWWVKNSLEWAYRLIKQPTRIKRQIHLVKFLWLLILNKI